MKRELPATNEGIAVASKARGKGTSKLTLRQERMRELEREYRQQTKHLASLTRDLKKKVIDKGQATRLPARRVVAE